MTKTSLSIDREKANAAAAVLGTTTLTATVDAALTEIVNMERRRRLVERMRRDGGIGPSDAERRLLRTP
jgi:Arc/MetJ family transcription regulator